MAKTDYEYKFEAKRGFVYLFVDKGAKWTDKYVLVVSDDSRATDRMISILVLGDSPNGNDTVAIQLPNLGTKYAHCGMVTYLARHLLAKEICRVPGVTMKQINRQLVSNLGIVDTQQMVEYNHFKEEYNRLLDKLISGGFKVD